MYSTHIQYGQARYIAILEHIGISNNWHNLHSWCNMVMLATVIKQDMYASKRSSCSVLRLAHSLGGVAVPLLSYFLCLLDRIDRKKFIAGEELLKWWVRFEPTLAVLVLIQRQSRRPLEHPRLRETFSQIFSHTKHNKPRQQTEKTQQTWSTSDHAT